MSERYQIVSTNSNDRLPDAKELARFLAKDGQMLLPMLDLIEQSQSAIDDLIDVMGRATIEAVLQMSPHSLQARSSKASGPTATSPIMARKRAASLSRNASFAWTSRGCGKGNTFQENRAKSTFRPTPPCRRMNAWPIGCST